MSSLRRLLGILSIGAMVFFAVYAVDTIGEHQRSHARVK